MKVTILPNAIYVSVQSWSKYLGDSLQKYLKYNKIHMEPQKTQIPKTILSKGKKLERLTLQISKYITELYS